MSDVLYTLPVVDVLLNVSDSREEFESALAEFKKLATEQGVKFIQEVMLPKAAEGNRFREEVRNPKRRTYYDLSFTVQLLRVAAHQLEEEMWTSGRDSASDEDPDDPGSYLFYRDLF